jgi:DNA (cytosine-5)-methyltransferase 1
MYDEEHVSFFDLPQDALAVFDYQSCHSCDSRAAETQLEKDVKTDIGVVHYGVHYHLDDFIFIHPTGQSKLLDIGQITKFKGKLPNLEVHIRYLGRYDDYVIQQKSELEDLELALDDVRFL